MDLAVHLPLMQFGDEALSLQRLRGDRRHRAGLRLRRGLGQRPLRLPDALARRADALASMIERSGEMALATTVSLAVLRGPVPLAKTLAAIDVLSEGRLIAALGPGSSKRDYDALGMPFEERWKRFDEAIAVLRALLKGEPMPEQARHYPLPPDVELAPGPRHSGASRFGSEAGARRRGWLESRGRATAGSPPRTTRRRSASPPPARDWRRSSRPAGGSRTAFPTRSRRCGPGSRRIEPRPIGCSRRSWLRC